MEAPPLERKLVAILAADIAGYSRLMETDEEGTLSSLSAFRSITDDLISRHGGRICGTAGDSVLAAFGSALAAVECAVGIQNDLAQANDALEEDRRMYFRIGINVGDVMVKEGDIFGDGVNIAARLEGLAAPGGICISRGIHDHVMKKLPYEFEDLGEKSVKNIAHPVRVFRLILSGPKSELRPSEPAASLPDVEADLPSIPEGAPAVPEFDAQAVELAFWDLVKNSLRGNEYEAYLERYPEGNFAVLARARLEAISEDAIGMRDPQDRQVELAFWESVRESDNPALIQAYLQKYPKGEFSALAEIRIGELTPQDDRAAEGSES